MRVYFIGSVKKDKLSKKMLGIWNMNNLNPDIRGYCFGSFWDILQSPHYPNNYNLSAPKV